MRSWLEKLQRCKHQLTFWKGSLLGGILAFSSAFAQQECGWENELCVSCVEEVDTFFFLEQTRTCSTPSWGLSGEVFYWAAKESKNFYGDQYWIYGGEGTPPFYYLVPTGTIFSTPQRSLGFAVSMGLLPQENGWGCSAKATFFKQERDRVFQGTDHGFTSGPKIQGPSPNSPLWVFFSNSFLGKNNFTYFKTVGNSTHFFTDKIFWHKTHDFQRVDVTLKGKSLCTPACGLALSGGVTALKMDVKDVLKVDTKKTGDTLFIPLSIEHTSITQGIGPRIGITPSMMFRGFSLYAEFCGGVLSSVWQLEKLVRQNVVWVGQINNRPPRSKEPTVEWESKHALSAFFDVEVGFAATRERESIICSVEAGLDSHLFLLLLAKKVNQEGEKIFGVTGDQILLLPKTKILFQNLFLGGGFLRASVAF